MAAARQPAPLDALTRLPLPINYRPGERPEGGGIALPLKPDLHHGFFEEETFMRTELGRVTRESWGVIVPRWAHDRYHELVDPMQPTKDSLAWVWALIAAAAGYIPPEGVSLPQKGELEIVALSSARRALLRSKRGVHVPNPDRVRRGILGWVVEHGFDAPLNEVEDFVETNDVVIMEVYGEAFMRQASYEATRPLQEVYTEAYNSGCLPKNASQAIGECVFHMLAKAECGATNMHAVGWLRTILRQGLEQGSVGQSAAAIA